MTGKVLIVDDEANVLSALKRSLRKIEEVHTALGPIQGLQAIEKDGPFAVVISDQQMPDMDGISFLKEVMNRSPNSIRIMLTGNADQKTAVEAVKEGGIYRFLNKPCGSEELAGAIVAARERYDAQVAEKELLQNTLAGSVKLLVDVVSLRDPKNFEHTFRIRAWAKKVADRLGLNDAWKLDMIAMLSSIGDITLPAEVTAKINGNQRLSIVEQELVQRAPEVARDLISNIPRLQAIGEAIYYQNRGYDGSGFPEDGATGSDIPLHGRLLKILKDLAAATEETEPGSPAFDILRQSADLYDPKLLDIVAKCLARSDREDAGDRGTELLSLSASALKPGDVTAAKIFKPNGTLVVTTDRELTAVAIQKLRQYVKLKQIDEPIQVRRPI